MHTFKQAWSQLESHISGIERQSLHLPVSHKQSLDNRIHVAGVAQVSKAYPLTGRSLVVCERRI